MTSGFLLINKPSGPTSHDVIDELRRITGIKRIGHAGTLDPFASGLLIVGVGREATRGLSGFLKSDKEYSATLKLGATSNTYDRDGKIEATEYKKPVTKEKINKIIESFTGEIKQVPPMYSAKKVKGQKLYELARKGQTIERQPAQVKISMLQIISYKYPCLELVCRVSSGTYIRSLAHDIGQALGCGAYLEQLVRTAIGDYKLTKAAELKDLTSENWQQHLMQINHA